MNTTENISLSGYAFTIEKDAYEALSAYIDAIHRKFAADPCAEEICRDIEERIGELFLEKCPGGRVVNIEAVEYAKGRIGDPSDFDGKDESPDESPSGSRTRALKGRKMYRDVDERVVSGVCSGLGHYLNFNKVFLRLGFVFLTLFGLICHWEWLFFSPILLYICLMICVPAAKTVEQRCEMKQQPVTLDSFVSRDFSLQDEIREIGTSPAARTVVRIVAMFIGMILLVVGIGGLFSCIFIKPLTELAAAHCTGLGEIYVDDIRLDLSRTLLSDRYLIIMLTAMVGLLSVWFIYNGVMMTFALKSPSWKPGLVLFIFWIISILAFVAWSLMLVADLIPTFVGV